MELKNYMEQLVWDQLAQINVLDASVCSCDKCRYDMAALALNNLTPHYVVTDKGETFTRLKALEQQFKVDVITAVIQAVETVKSRPRHS